MTKSKDRTPYEVLQIGDSSSERAIREAYLKRSLATHPDKGGQRCEFDAVQKAYETLCNSTSKERLVIAEEVDLGEMEESDEGWFYECRCGEGYSVKRESVGAVSGKSGVVVVCSGCSLGIRVVLD